MYKFVINLIRCLTIYSLVRTIKLCKVIIVRFNILYKSTTRYVYQTLA